MSVRSLPCRKTCFSVLMWERRQLKQYSLMLAETYRVFPTLSIQLSISALLGSSKIRSDWWQATCCVLSDLLRKVPNASDRDIRNSSEFPRALHCYRSMALCNLCVSAMI